MTALNLPTCATFLLSWNGKQLSLCMNIIDCATVLENALKEWQHVTSSRRVDTFNVPSPFSHYGPPYGYAWTFRFFFCCFIFLLFFFSITPHSSAVRAQWKAQENSAPGRANRSVWRGDTLPDTWKVARVCMWVLFSFVGKQWGNRPPGQRNSLSVK